MCVCLMLKNPRGRQRDAGMADELQGRFGAAARPSHTCCLLHTHTRTVHVSRRGERRGPAHAAWCEVPRTWFPVLRLLCSCQLLHFPTLMKGEVSNESYRWFIKM